MYLKTAVNYSSSAKYAIGGAKLHLIQMTKCSFPDARTARMNNEGVNQIYFQVIKNSATLHKYHNPTTT